MVTQGWGHGWGFSPTRQKRGKACREPPHSLLSVFAPHGLLPPSPVSSSWFGTSPRVYPHPSAHSKQSVLLGSGLTVGAALCDGAPLQLPLLGEDMA